jgi:hypothetical protein
VLPLCFREAREPASVSAAAISSSFIIKVFSPFFARPKNGGRRGAPQNHRLMFFFVRGLRNSPLIFGGGSNSPRPFSGRIKTFECDFVMGIVAIHESPRCDTITALWGWRRSGYRFAIGGFARARVVWDWKFSPKFFQGRRASYDFFAKI